MQSLPQSSEATLPDPEKLVLCKACQHAVTSARQAIEVNGAHQHTFRNPAGYSFHVLCYQEAPGCDCLGHPTTDATWFSGYAWTFAVCELCHQHVGWAYRGPQNSFFGLIATRLAR